ncbi:MAG: DUF3127 domain-containing protein [Cytophagales bacterium]
MNQFKITGKFLGHSLIKEIGEKKTKVRNFWLDITTDANYPNTPQFDLIGDKCVLTDNIKAGDQIVLSFNINGRKWEKEGKKGVNINLGVYKIEKMVLESTAFVPQTNGTNNEQIVDDLPF